MNIFDTPDRNTSVGGVDMCGPRHQDGECQDSGTREHTMYWAIFTENDNEYWAGLYITEHEAEEDLYGRPEGCHVARACECVDGLTRPAAECIVCSMIEEDGHAE